MTDLVILSNILRRLTFSWKWKEFKYQRSLILLFIITNIIIQEWHSEDIMILFKFLVEIKSKSKIDKIEKSLALCVWGSTNHRVRPFHVLLKCCDQACACLVCLLSVVCLVSCYMLASLQTVLWIIYQLVISSMNLVVMIFHISEECPHGLRRQEK